MKKYSTKDSLISVLSYCGLTDLPEVENKKEIWIRAIAKILKSDGCEYYAYVEKDRNTLENKVVKDFGSISSIVKVIEYYPYSYLSSHFLPQTGNNKNAKIDYLVKLDKSKDYSKMSIKELNAEIIKTAIYMQIDYENRNNIALQAKELESASELDCEKEENEKNDDFLDCEKEENKQNDEI